MTPDGRVENSTGRNGTHQRASSEVVRHWHRPRSIGCSARAPPVCGRRRGLPRRRGTVLSRGTVGSSSWPSPAGASGLVRKGRGHELAHVLRRHCACLGGSSGQVPFRADEMVGNVGPKSEMGGGRLAFGRNPPRRARMWTNISGRISRSRISRFGGSQAGPRVSNSALEHVASPRQRFVGGADVRRTSSSVGPNPAQPLVCPPHIGEGARCSLSLSLYSASFVEVLDAAPQASIEGCRRHCWGARRMESESVVNRVREAPRCRAFQDRPSLASTTICTRLALVHAGVS